MPGWGGRPATWCDVMQCQDRAVAVAVSRVMWPRHTRVTRTGRRRRSRGGGVRCERERQGPGEGTRAVSGCMDDVGSMFGRPLCWGFMRIQSAATQ